MSQTVNLLLLAGCVMQSLALPLTPHQDTAAKDTHKIFQEGEPIKLDCEADGTYAPNFHWLFNNVYQEQGPLDNMAKNLMTAPILHKTTKLKTSFQIDHALPEHSGRYTCVADTITKRATKSYTVQVESATDRKHTETEEDSSSVRIYEWAVELSVVEGEPMYVPCRATQGITKPVPTIVWTIGDKRITETDNIKIHSNGDLEVKATTVDFHFWEGDLSCHATSDDGHSVDKKDTFVYVYQRIKDSDSSETNSE